ncbi:MAG TPA: hypothetical protein VMW45_03710 [Dehalococcoidia bacterium]|nr:hypothetical protein [Dehalococcoidia bacterium]
MTREEIRNEIIGILRERNKLLIANGQNPKAEYSADQIIDLFDKAGWESPEEIARQEQRFVESEKILNREAAFEEQRLHAEVEYWKGKNYRLG